MREISEYENLRNQILKADSWDELQDLQKLIANAELTEDDKFILGANIRARYGNHIQ